MSIPEKTPEQQRREELHYQLAALIMPVIINGGTVEQSAVLWLRPSEWFGDIEFHVFEDEGLIKPDYSIQHKPDGTLNDRFPPFAFRLTEKGWNVWSRPSEWIWTGEFEKNPR